MSTLGCGASIKKMLEVSNDDIAVIEETLAERRRSGVPLAEAQKQAVAEAMAQLEVERKKIMDAINEQHPPEAVLTAPTRQDVVEQQKRVENAPALDEKAQIDREAEKQTLTQPTAPDQRSDTSGDMFAREKAQAVVDKKNEGKPNKDTATGDLLAQPAAEAGPALVEHTTQRGKVLQGYVFNVAKDRAAEIDPYTFRKDGGYFVRKAAADSLPRDEFATLAAAKAEPTAVAKKNVIAEGRENAIAEKAAETKPKVSMLRAMGEKVAAEAEAEASRERNTNTARRARMAAGSEAQARAREAIGKTMINLADAIESGDAPALEGITSRAQVETLDTALRNAMTDRDRAEQKSYAQTEKEKGRPPDAEDVKHAKLPRASWTSGGASPEKLREAIKGKKGNARAVALLNVPPTAELLSELKKLGVSKKDLDYGMGWWNQEAIARLERLKRAGIETDPQLKAALTQYLAVRGGVKKADPIKELERKLIGQKVGVDFFPTPTSVAERMVREAGITKGMRVLEPSAGSGNIADAIKAAGGKVDAVEISSSLRELLEAKTHDVVANDFMEYKPAEKYDAIVMNPPFSNRMDAEHIQRAYDMLKPGGKLVAIAGEGVFFGTDKKAEAFREWLSENRATIEKLPTGTFTDTKLLATTGTNARLVVIEKSKDAPSFRQSDIERAAASMKAQAIREAIAPAVDKLKIPFALHDTVADARAKTGQDIPAGAKGMHWKGGIHLFGENLHSRLETEKTLWHEVQHAGFREAYGKTADGYEKALRGLSLQNGNIREAARAWAEKYGEEDTKARIAGGMSPEDAAYRTKLQAIDEALAELAGRNAKINGLPMFLAKVQEFMRAIGLTHLADALEKATNAQALAMIAKSRESVMKSTEAPRSQQMAPAFSKDDASYSRAIDKASETLDRIKGSAAAKDVGTAWDGIQLATAPQYRSEAAREMARQLIAGMGEKEMRSIKFRTDLNRSIAQNEKATTLGAKARDLMEKGLTVQADKVFLRQSIEENREFMQAMDTGDQSYFEKHADLKPMADVIAKMFAEKAQAIRELGTGALQNLRENYFPHLWNREPAGDAQREIFSTLAKRPLEGRKAFTKERIFDDVQAGLDAGFEPVSNNPLDLVALKMEEMDKYILAHKTLSAMEGSNGVHLIAAGEKTPKGFTDVNGRFGTIERNGEKLRYVARDDVAQVINNYLSPSLYHNKYVGKPFTAYMGAANMLNQFQLGVFSAFHAGFTSMEAVISHASIGVKALTAGDLKGAAKYLGSAPAAWINNPKMGSKIIEHMLDSAAHPEMGPILEGLQMAGFKWQMDNRFRTDATKNMLQAWQEGKKFKAGVNSIPALAEQTARPILEWLVPRQKFGVFGEMYSKWMQDNPTATHEDLRNSAQQIWNRVDSRLGQVVYDRLFVHNVAKNFAQMLIRAPGWTGGTILEVGGGIKDLAGYFKDIASGKKPDSISDRAAYTLSMLMVTATVNAAMTAMFTGAAPDDWRDLVAFRTGNLDEHGRTERFMLPTYMKDVYAYSKAPGTTLVNKAHPLLSLVGDIGRNRDFYGTEIRSEDDNLLTQLAQTAGFTAKAFVPFWVKGVQKEQQREGSALATAAPLFGVMPAPSDLNKTDAEKLITKYAADRLPQGSRTQEETEKADLRRQMYLALRKGEQDKAKELFDQGRTAGLFGPRDYLKVVRQARQDPLVGNFAHLTYDQAERVMRVANDDERQELAPAFMKKRVAWQRQHQGAGAE